MTDDFDDDEIEMGVETIDEFAMDGDRFRDARYGSVETTGRPSISYVNESGLPDDVIMRHFRGGDGMQEISSIIERWSQSLHQPGVSQSLDIFNRTRWSENQSHIHATMSKVAWAVENDDTLSTLADVIEGLMWSAKNRFELIDEDQEDFWNQWSADINLDEMLRQMGREEFKVSQFYMGLWWENKVYRVQDDEITDQIDELQRQRDQRDYQEAMVKRQQDMEVNKDTPGYVPPPEPPKPPAKTGGNRTRRKVFPVTVPTACTIFDPTKIMPVGTLMFGREQFAYIADENEHEAFSHVMQGDVVDDTVLQLIQGLYTPTPQDKAACAEVGVDPTRLWLFRPGTIFRHTMTRAQYERYASVRMKSLLPILEMKAHLRNSDRSTLIGNTNFIVVITKGSDKMPAKAAEIENLKEQARIIARLPVLVGDHRLKVEIVAPPTENTLIESRWQTLDQRLVFAALKTFTPITQSGQGGGSIVKDMSTVVAKGLESRRHMIVRSLERFLFRLIVDRNQSVLDEYPTLVFTPKRITLDFSSDVIAQVLKLRDRGDISRETTLQELDYDQDTEVIRRAKERVVYDEVFDSTTPFTSPVQNPYGPTASPNTEGGNTPTAQAPAATAAPASNVGPNGQPRTEGGRPAGAADVTPRQTQQ